MTDIATRAPKKVTIDYSNGKIYKVVNTQNDMIYIGSTTQLLPKRMYGHRADALTKTTALHQAMRDIGREEFKIILIEFFPCSSKAELEAKEFEITNMYQRSMLYNMNFDGKQSPESRKILSQAQIGSKRSAETCKNISDSLIGRKLSPQCCQKISEANKGRASTRFARGCILDRIDEHMFAFQWREQGKSHSKAFSYRNLRSREQAYMCCIDHRNVIFPLSFTDYAIELPFANE